MYSVGHVGHGPSEGYAQPSENAYRQEAIARASSVYSTSFARQSTLLACYVT